MIKEVEKQTKNKEDDSMIKIEEVFENICKLYYESKEELVKNIYDDITCSFEDYNIEGETEVIMSEEVEGLDLYVYISHLDSPEILINFEKDEEGDIILDAVLEQ